MTKSLFLFKTFLLCCALLSVLSACGDYGKTEKTLTDKDRAYIKGLGLLEDGETIERFKSGSKFQQSGNFFTDKRIATYWVEDGEKEIHSAFYKEIDSMTLTDKTRAVTLASYVTVYPANETAFNVYIDLDSAGIQSFFREAETSWKQHK